MTDSEKKIFARALDHFGIRAQIMMVFEEMSELQKELCKLVRGRKTLMEIAIAEEITDVEIMLDQMKLHFKLEELVSKFREEKVNRLDDRLEKENNE